MRSKFIICALLLLSVVFVHVGTAAAIPTQFGDSGLFSQPSADTLNSGNICIGLWGNCSENQTGKTTIMPVAMTLGLGSFLEAYGSYPNLLFNDDEMSSRRGFSNIGFKMRVYGKRSSALKVGIDGQLRRTVTSDLRYDGLTDKVGRVVVSFKPDNFGAYLNAGFVEPESPENQTYDNQTVYGGGIDYFPTARLRFIAEASVETAKVQSGADYKQAMAGFQYFITPHLTLNLGVGSSSQDFIQSWRILFGLSSCQGVGTYSKPIPRQVQPQPEQVAETKPETKIVKVKTLTPLIPKAKTAEAVPVENKFEIPVGEAAEEVVLTPTAAGLPAVSVGAGVSLPVAAVPETAGAGATAVTTMSMTEGIPLLQVAPQVAGAAASTAMAMPVELDDSLRKLKTGRSYKIKETVKTDDNKSVGQKIVDDPRYTAQFITIQETSTRFIATFFHRYDKTLDVWIEGADGIKHTFSATKAAPFEDVTLTVEKVKGKVPYFKLHLGEHSEVFEFYKVNKTVGVGKVDIVVTPLEAKPVKPATTAVEQSAESTNPNVAVSAGTVANTVDAVASSVTPVTSPVASPPPSGASIKAVVYRKFRIPSTVFFGFDDATLTEEGKAAVAEIAETIRKEKRWFVIRVDGFTDNVGSNVYNLKLGLKRAIALASYLVTNNGIDPSILFVKSSGEDNPLTTNETEAGRAQNRRAEILMFVPKDGL